MKLLRLLENKFLRDTATLQVGSMFTALANFASAAALAFLLGPRSEQIPVADGALCLGQWQRILLFSLDAQHRPEWTLTLLV